MGGGVSRTRMRTAGRRSARRRAVTTLLAVALSAAAGSCARTLAADDTPAMSLTRRAEGLVLPASAGDAGAQTQLAEYYERGWGVPQDFARAIDLYRQAARVGHRPALARLTALGVPLVAPSRAPVDEVADEGGEPRVMHYTITSTKYVRQPDAAFPRAVHSAFSAHEIFIRSSPKGRVISGGVGGPRRSTDRVTVFGRDHRAGRRPLRVTDFPRQLARKATLNDELPAGPDCPVLRCRATRGPAHWKRGE